MWAAARTVLRGRSNRDASRTATFAAAHASSERGWNRNVAISTLPAFTDLLQQCPRDLKKSPRPLNEGIGLSATVGARGTCPCQRLYVHTRCSSLSGQRHRRAPAAFYCVVEFSRGLPIADCLRISSKDDEEKTKTNSMHEGIHDYHYCSFDLEEKSFASRFSVNESKIAEYRIQRRSAWKRALACWRRLTVIG
jgi:hypothetical protein